MWWCLHSEHFSLSSHSTLGTLFIFCLKLLLVNLILIFILHSKFGKWFGKKYLFITMTQPVSAEKLAIVSCDSVLRDSTFWNAINAKLFLHSFNSHLHIWLCVKRTHWSAHEKHSGSICFSFIFLFLRFFCLLCPSIYIYIHICKHCLKSKCTKIKCCKCQ